MQSLLLVPPARIQGITGGGNDTSAARLGTNDPKEVYYHPPNSDTQVAVTITLQSTDAIDRLFLGFTTLPATASIAFYTGSTTSNANDGPSGGMTRVPSPDGNTSHWIAKMGTVFNTKLIYLVITFPANTAFTAGIFRAGLGFQPVWGHEYGAGRPITDTGVAERLFGGGFGVDEGVRVGGYQWTFGDLQAAERDRLYEIALDRGTTRPLLLIEDPEIDGGLFRRIHWGLFAKLDAYERVDPLNTKWSLAIADWG